MSAERVPLERRIGRRVPWVLAALLALAYGPDLLRSPLLQGDLPGHVETIRWSAVRLWPLPWGWDPRYLCGAPAGILYPPLLAWLGGGLAKLVGAEGALRMLLWVSIVVLPPALALAGRGLGLRPWIAGWASAAGLAVLWLPWRGLGGSLHQTLLAGNAANALALPLFLVFLYRLRPGLARSRGWSGAAALLALILLTHFIVGALAGLTLVAFTLWRAWRLRSMTALARGVRIAAAALLAAGPFLVPFLWHFREASPDAIGMSVFPSAIEWLALAAVTLLVLIHPRWTAHPMIPLLMLLMLLYLLRGVVFPVLGTPPFRMEYHRFRLFLYLATVPALFLLLQSRPVLRRTARALAIGLTALLLVLLGGFRYNARGPQPLPPPGAQPDLRGHRVLVLASPAAQNGAWHALQLQLPARLGATGLKGLFVEAAPLARSVFELERIAAGPGVRPRWWAIRVADSSALRALPAAEVARRFAELGVDTIVAREPVSSAVLNLLAAFPEDLGNGYVLYRLSPAPLARVWEPGGPGAFVPCRVAEGGSRLELTLPPDREVHLAGSAFSDWRVEEGQAVLETAPPGMLRVRGRGPVVLAVRPRAEEWLGLAAGAWGWLWILLLRGRRRRGAAA